MKQGQSQSKCLWVARDIAAEIAKEERPAGDAIPGMSILASKYGVSPETIRRAVSILAGRGVVEVKPQSRTKVKSVAKARQYISDIEKDNELRNAYRSIREIAGEYKALNARLLDALDYFVERKTSLSPIESPFPNYEIPIPDDADLIGKTIGDLQFWRNTKCTIVGIKRKAETIVSPGPYLAFEKGDIIVVIGTAEAVENAVKLIRRL
jgi:K+/H+ antiporter YhaU regulatory subunit KhtT